MRFVCCSVPHLAKIKNVEQVLVISLLSWLCNILISGKNAKTTTILLSIMKINVMNEIDY